MNRGALLGVSAYLLWGLSPVYWRIEGDVALLDVILWRAAGAALLLVGWQLLRGSFRRLRALVAQPRDFLMFVLTASLLATNWIAFIWVVTTDRVLEASLGYFINPMMSVALGVVVLRERLNLVPLLTVLVAACGVLVLAVDVGAVPWTALYLGGSFALYGLFRKTSPAGSMDGLTIEMLVLLPFVLCWLVVRALSGDGVFGLSDIGLDVWLIGSGAMTIAPLLLFSAAARRIELWIVGMLQFLAPTIQFLLGVVLWDEPWGGGQALGFVLIWLALIVFVADAGLQVRRVRRISGAAVSGSSR
ncbi:MAG: EamA family transporter RarD [Acidimicrobiaceae bacterium]|nr:EamA family transporter RarD [Acidimicrobiia bacterium]MCY4495117.1 EamA family transporter RarD [Acidimicrobiaceae bacterium]